MSLSTPRRPLIGTALLAAGLVGCTVGPDYQRPAAPVPAAYKEEGWRPARPADTIDRGAWWSLYHDPVLDRLERQIDISNQNLKAAEAAFRQAEAIVAQARAGFFPTGTLNASAQRFRGGGSAGSTSAARGGVGSTSPGRGVGGGGGGTSAGGGGTSTSRGRSGGSSGSISNSFSLTEAFSWIPDLWGRVERTVEGDVASAQASASDVASARLAAQSQLASDYMQLRIADALKRLLDQAVKAYTESLRIARNQYAAGTAAASDVAQAQTQLETTQAQAIAVGVMRAQLEHAIAILIGKPPAELTIAPIDSVAEVPVIPSGLPSALLERRPDIAAAERRMAAANAQIGVAEAAFFPNITLSGDSGVTSSKLNKLLTASSRVWSFGSTLAETIFDAGARHGQVEQARAVLDADTAAYRQSVLAAFQQVEDQLAALRILAEQAAAERAALASAREAERIIFNQYKAGTVAYTSVVVAQTAALSNAETVLNVQQSRLVASVALIEALGGGWDASRLPSRGRIEEDSPLNFSPFPPPDAVPALTGKGR